MSLKLLVVEDDHLSLELMREVFASLKAEVVPIDDGQCAAEAVSREKFDGIFLDLEMPTMHGFELARRIRISSWNRRTPIVIVTGRDDRKTMHDAFEMGATFFLQKPVDRQKLTALFRAVRGSMVENRRRNTRAPLQTRVSCSNSSTIVNGMTWNISQGGIQIDGASLLRPGDQTRVSFRLPTSGEQIDTSGIVTWVNQNRQGIRFTNLNARHAQVIREFVAEVEDSNQPEAPRMR